jgi:hypothetical protein
MVAINHARAQILAPHRETDPWAGLDRAGEAPAVPPAESIATADPDATLGSMPVAGGNAEGWPESDFDR